MYKMEFYLVEKKSETILFIRLWMELTILLEKIDWNQKDKHCMLSLIFRIYI